MRIYTFYSDSHKPLLEGWVKTSKREFGLITSAIHIPIESDGDYRNVQWNAILSTHEALVIGLINSNMGEIIGITGVDVRFIRPFTQDVKDLMEGKDILFQDEDGTGTYWNPDVMFIRCTLDVLQAWIVYVQLLPHWNGHMDHQNRLMKFAFANLQTGFLPIRYAATINGGAEADPVLFHANNTHAPNCVEKKLELLKPYE